MSTWTVTVPEEADDRLAAAILECCGPMYGGVDCGEIVHGADGAVWHPRLGVSITRAGEGVR